MERFNPLRAQLEAHENTLGELRVTQAALAADMAWYDECDPAKLTAQLAAEQESVAAYDVQLEEIKTTLRDVGRRAKELMPATRMGWNPAYWMSSERSATKSGLAKRVAEIRRLQAERDRVSGEREIAAQRLSDVEAAVARYAGFNRPSAVGALSQAEAEVSSHSASIEDLRMRADALDEELDAPRTQFVAIGEEVEELTRDLGRAERLLRELKHADNSYERAMVHQECERRFGTGSPAAAIGRLQKELAAKERTSEKLERRLHDIARRGSREIRSLVIDGSNLCYEGDKLVGLFALRELCARLQDEYELTVIFDASIRARLGLPSDDRLREQLSGVTVHVTAPGTSADETILDLADDPMTFVVSNDRFVDFPEKGAVRDRRVIRHEIVGGRVLVRDLKVDVEFSNRTS